MSDTDGLRRVRQVRVLAQAICDAITLAPGRTPERSTSLAFGIADAIIAAGWTSPAEVEQAKCAAWDEGFRDRLVALTTDPPKQKTNPYRAAHPPTEKDTK